MPFSGYTGISFPFRVNTLGGVTTSSTSATDVTHIVESMQQIILTNYKERQMDSEVYSSVDSFLFEPNDISLQTLLRMQLVETFERLEDRIEVEEEDIEFVVEDNVLYATITFLAVDYQTYHTTTLKVGDTLNE